MVPFANRFMDNLSAISPKRSRPSLCLALLLSNFITLAFWTITYFTNVYYWAVGGTIFEILWLPMLIAVFALPVIAFISWMKEKFSLRSLFLYSLLVSGAVGVWLWWLG